MTPLTECQIAGKEAAAAGRALPLPPRALIAIAIRLLASLPSCCLLRRAASPLLLLLLFLSAPVSRGTYSHFLLPPLFNSSGFAPSFLFPISAPNAQQNAVIR